MLSGPSPATAQQAAAVVSPSAVERQAKPKPKPYEVKPGITFNTATGPMGDRVRILNKLIRLTNNTKKGEVIRIMSWNIRSPRANDALLAAQRRGVRLWLMIDKANSGTAELPNPGWRSLARSVRNINQDLPEHWKRSRLQTCSHACRRGENGAAHSKFYLFSKVGKSENVVVQGSANLTTASALNQWNEIYTTVDRKPLYDFALGVFRQMWEDKAVKPAWVSFTSGRYTLNFSPQKGKSFEIDPLEQALKRTECTGAVGAGNANGRTIIRAAPDVIRGDRGMRAARLLRALWNDGCDVKMGYTVMGVDVKRYLTRSSGRGPVPLRHLVQDFDGDGFFDNYFHLKVWTINGKIGKDKSGYWATNGSSNTSDLSTNSDENIGVFDDMRAPTLRYQRFIDKWVNNFPTSRAFHGRLAPGADPYKNLEMD